MVGETPSVSGSKSPDRYDFDDPLFLHPFDNGVVSIISFKLTGTKNFRIWKISMTRALKARNKLGFVDKTFPKPSEDETKIRK